MDIRVLPVLAAALLASLLSSAGAVAAEPIGAPIKAYSATITTSQAGAHPDMSVDFIVGTRQESPRTETGANQIKNGLVETPAGFIGNPHAAPECTAGEFGLDECAADAQVGTADPYIGIGDGCCNEAGMAPIYNLVPQPGQAGLLAWKAPIAGFPIFVVIGARTDSDYGLNAEVKGITANFSLGRYKQTLWGVPASPIHDNQRFKKGGGFAAFFYPPPEVSNSPERPFLSNPTTCSGPLTSNFVSMAYDRGRDEKTAPWPETTGCEQLGFNPSLAAKPTTEAADSPSGLDVTLRVPQNDSPATPSDSEIRGITTVLPPGFSINSNGADGKVSCTDNEARFGTTEEAQCPEFSKVGTVSIDSWALPDAIPGAVYLGEPQPGNRYRIFITGDGFGTHIKLAGSAYPDPQTGQLTVTFKDLPQAPLTEFTMHFFGSERGLLATPNQCGTFPVQSTFEPWATGLPNQIATQFFSISSGPDGEPCPAPARGFAPSFRAAGATNGAGSHSPFSVYVTRKDGDQTLSTIGANTPPGFTATLKGIPKCPEATLQEIDAASWTGLDEVANPKCPIASRVGVSSAGAGSGSKPFYAPGTVYLAGPYRGAPVSFAVVTPAVSGPYDLGNVVNRVAVNVDPTTAAVTAVSDPLPQLLDGVPLRLRALLINLDRPGFTLNPTNCDPFAVTGLLTGDQGGAAQPQAPFQVANCDTLAFEPKLRTVVRGPVRRGGHPALTVTLTQDSDGAANIAKAVVTLPHSEFLEQSHIRTICTRVQFAAAACPPGSVYGKARAITPLLDQPLEGPVYLRASSHLLPDLVADLHGPASEPVEVVLAGKVDSPNQSIRTTFSTVPDTPVSKFTLQMQGGKKGLLVNSTNICTSTQKVDAKFTGQNGARVNQNPPLVASCGKAATKKKRAGR
jgi:hypothetical protein